MHLLHPEFTAGLHIFELPVDDPEMQWIIIVAAQPESFLTLKHGK
jgi:hypothetical protein